MVKKHFYAVAVGRERGIYSTWAQCQAQVHGYAGARFKGFPTLDEARAYLQGIPLASVPTLLSSTPSLPSLWGRECPTDSCDGLPTVQERAPARRRERSPEEEAYTVVSSGADSDVDGDAEGEAPRARQRHKAEANAYDDSRTASQCDVFVDGACSNNGRGRASQAGYGGYYGDGDSRNFSMPLSPYEAHTNNRAELHAVIRALRRAITDAGMNGENVPDIRVAARAAAAGEVELPQLRVHSDSKYVIDGLTKYSKKWVGNGFTLSDGSSPVQNQDLWKELIRLRDVYNSCYASQTVGKLQVYDVLNTHNTESDGFRILHVKGHSNIHGNVMADRLAVQGAQKSWHSV